MEVEIISKSSIIPSSPTPSHLKTYKYSLLDQFQPSAYFPTILFYQNSQETNHTNDQILKRSQLLKQSLSETLTRFYPLGGKTKDNISIDCNDEGVSYIEARTNISLSQYLNQLDLKSLQNLMPSAPSLAVFAPPGSPVVMIQETTFSCGGLTIGLYVLHITCDGTSSTSFLKDWASTACNHSTDNTNKEISYPFMDASSIFPPINEFPKEASTISLFVPFLKKGKTVTSRFVFNSSAIASLKAKASSNNPTRVEVVTALLSKCLMTVFKAKSGIDKSLAVNLIVNLRRRDSPPFPQCSMGNFLWPVAVFCTPEENELSGLVCQFKEAIQKMDSDFVKSIKNEGGFSKLYDSVKEMGKLFANPKFPSEIVEFAMFTSWCNFGLYDVDFGWGKPVWTSWLAATSNIEIPSMNLIVLMDTRTERGIEAWVSMNEDYMVFLEKDEELLQYASVNPSPLQC